MKKRVRNNVQTDVLESATDLRGFRRENVELLLHFAEFLPPSDREIIHAVFVHQQSLGGLAELSRLPRLQVYRHLRRLLRRVSSRRFRTVIRHRRSLGRRERFLAQLWIVENRSIRQLRSDLDCSIHQVRRQQTELTALLAKLDAGW